LTPAAGAELRVLVVDDEAPARAVLREYLERLPGVRVLAECANGFEALKAAEAGRASGRRVPRHRDAEAERLRGPRAARPAIVPVFVTAYDAWAVKAFEVHAVDYVMKPFAPERIAAAVARVRERLRARDLPSAEAVAAAARPRAATSSASWSATARGCTSSRRRACRPHARRTTTWRSAAREGLSQGADARRARGGLDPARFVRVHRSHLVNVDFLSRLEGYAKTGFTAILSDGTRVPVSREGHSRLKAVLGDEQAD
jgi:two-component system LytT family response regulator